MNYIAILFFKAPTLDILVETKRRMMDKAEAIFVAHGRNRILAP